MDTGQFIKEVTQFFKSHKTSVFRNDLDFNGEHLIISRSIVNDLRLWIKKKDGKFTFEVRHLAKVVFSIESPSFTLAKVAVNVFLANHKGELNK